MARQAMARTLWAFASGMIVAFYLVFGSTWTSEIITQAGLKMIAAQQTQGFESVPIPRTIEYTQAVPAQQSKKRRRY